MILSKDEKIEGKEEGWQVLATITAVFTSTDCCYMDSKEGQMDCSFLYSKICPGTEQSFCLKVHLKSMFLLNKCLD